MQFEIQANVLGAESYDMEGNSATNLWIAEKSDMLGDNQVGIIPTKIKAPFEMIDQIRKENFPVTLSLKCTQKKSSGNKTEIVCLEFKKAPVEVATESTATETNTNKNKPSPQK